MTASDYQAYVLETAACEQLGLDPLPFPVRTRSAKSIFDQTEISLPGLLNELDLFLAKFPEQRPRYRHNIATLAVLCSAKQMDDGDLKGVLETLRIGLMVDPVNGGLQVRQALALQIKGDHNAAAIEYGLLLQKQPYALDPLICLLAAKAFAAFGDQTRALRVLETLPDDAFADEGLQALRESFKGNAPITKADTHATALTNGDLPAAHKSNDAVSGGNQGTCPSCGKANTADKPFCIGCGSDLKADPLPSGQFCGDCGSPMIAGRQFCTQCGARLP